MAAQWRVFAQTHRYIFQSMNYTSMKLLFAEGRESCVTGTKLAGGLPTRVVRFGGAL